MRTFNIRQQYANRRRLVRRGGEGGWMERGGWRGRGSDGVVILELHDRIEDLLPPKFDVLP
jgi:hypothetical protein